MIEYPICQRKLDVEEFIRENQEIPDNYRHCVGCVARLEVSAQARLCLDFLPVGQATLQHVHVDEGQAFYEGDAEGYP